MHVVKWVLCVCVFALFFSSSAANAQELKYARMEIGQSWQEVALLKRSFYWQACMTNLFKQPFIKQRGVVYDYSPVRPAAFEGIRKFGDFSIICGEAISVLSDGVLVSQSEEVSLGGTIFVRNVPLGYVDGSLVTVFAKPDGAYRYTAVTGAAKTVPAFTVGEKMTTSDFRFATFKAAEYQDDLRRKKEAQAKEAKEKQEKEMAVKKAATESRVITFLKKRVAQGSASAAYKLGVRYLEGDGVETNKAEAVRLLTLAANEGDKKAQEKLKEQGIEQ